MVEVHLCVGVVRSYVPAHPWHTTRGLRRIHWHVRTGGDHRVVIAFSLLWSIDEMLASVHFKPVSRSCSGSGKPIIISSVRSVSSACQKSRRHSN